MHCFQWGAKNYSCFSKEGIAFVPLRPRRAWEKQFWTLLPLVKHTFEQLLAHHMNTLNRLSSHATVTRLPHALALAAPRMLSRPRYSQWSHALCIQNVWANVSRAFASLGTCKANGIFHLCMRDLLWEKQTAIKASTEAGEFSRSLFNLASQ